MPRRADAIDLDRARGSAPPAVLPPPPRRAAAAMWRHLRRGLGLGDFIAIFAEPVARWLQLQGCACAARRARLNRLTLRLDNWHLATLVALLAFTLLLLR